MCISTRIKKYLAEKEALDAKIAQLEKLEAATAPVKSLLTELLVNYAAEAPEELPGIWEEVLVIGQQHGLPVQMLAAEELREWEATKAENKKLKQQLEESETIITDQDRAWGEISDQLDDANAALNQLKSDIEAHIQKPNLFEVWNNKEEIRAGLEKLSQEAQEEVLTGEAYDRAIEKELALDDDGEELKEWQCKFEGKKWEVQVLNESADGTVSLLFQAADEGFTAKATIAEREECDVSLTEYAKIILERKFAKTIDTVETIANPVEGLENSGQLNLEFATSTAEQVVEQVAEELTLDAKSDVVEYKPEEAYDTVESLLKAHGFFQPENSDEICEEELAESYRGWDIFASIPNGGIIALGLYHPVSDTVWDASTEYIQTIDSLFPESFADYDEIVAWTRALIDQVENLEAPGQLALEFPAEDSAVPEATKLQKLLEGTNNYIFEKLGARVKIDSEFITNNHGEEPEEVEEALFTVTDLDGGKVRHYYHSAEDLTEYKPIVGWNPLGNLVNTAESYAKKWAKEQSLSSVTRSQNFDAPIALEPIAEEASTEKLKTETRFETMGFKVQVYPQYAGENNLAGATFKFLNAEHTVIFDSSRTAAEIGDRNWKTCAWDLIQDYRDKEAARLEKLANPYAKEEDKFLELVKLSNDVGYLKEKATGNILAGYAAFSNKKADGKKTETQAKTRAQKWADFLKNSIQLECLPPRTAKRMVSNNAFQTFAYEVKIVKPSIGQLTKLAEEDLSLLPLEREDKQNRAELRSLELKSDNGNDKIKGIEQRAKSESFTDNEVKIVESIRAALSKFNAEAVQEINSAEVPESVRDKVWKSLSEEEQKNYELLLKLEFSQAPDFSVQTPEFITSVDGKKGKSVLLSLRAIDGVSSRVWRYQGQTGDGGYSSKEAAAVAVWLQ